jgi:Tfp pilus assembly protein PilV
LVEVAIAATISALFLGSLFAMNAASMDTIKMARQAASASQLLQQRIESMRIANWHQITDANWLRDNLFATDVSGTDQLADVSETLTLIPYGSDTVGNTQMRRSNGTVAILAANPALLAESAIKVVWEVTYKGAPNARLITRQTVAILAKGGVAK